MSEISDYLCLDDIYDDVHEHLWEQGFHLDDAINGSYDWFLEDAKEVLLMQRITYKGIMLLAQGNQDMIDQCEIFDDYVTEAFDDWLVEWKKEEEDEDVDMIG